MSPEFPGLLTAIYSLLSLLLRYGQGRGTGAEVSGAAPGDRGAAPPVPKRRPEDKQDNVSPELWRPYCRESADLTGACAQALVDLDWLSISSYPRHSAAAPTKTAGVPRSPANRSFGSRSKNTAFVDNTLNEMLTESPSERRGTLV